LLGKESRGARWRHVDVQVEVQERAFSSAIATKLTERRTGLDMPVEGPLEFRLPIRPRTGQLISETNPIGCRGAQRHASLVGG
jgi:hypothetical protein